MNEVKDWLFLLLGFFASFACGVFFWMAKKPLEKTFFLLAFLVGCAAVAVKLTLLA